MDLHEGDLSIASEGEGFGCTFTIALPAKYHIREIPPPDAEAEADAGEFKVDSIYVPRSRNNSMVMSQSHRDGTPAAAVGVSLGSISFASPSKIAPEIEAGSAATGGKTAQCLMHSGKVFNTSDDVEIRPSSPITTGTVAVTATVTATATATSLLLLLDDQLPLCLPPPLLYKLLVVDDSISNRKMLVRLLRHKCSDITEAADGVEAVSIIRAAMKADRDRRRASIDINMTTATPTASFCSRRNYDAVLMDFIMPNMEGPEAARGMRELGYIGLIIGITGNALQADKERFINYGANMVLTKPVHLTELELALQLIATDRI